MNKQQLDERIDTLMGNEDQVDAWKQRDRQRVKALLSDVVREYGNTILDAFERLEKTNAYENGEWAKEAVAARIRRWRYELTQLNLEKTNEPT